MGVFMYLEKVSRCHNFFKIIEVKSSACTVHPNSENLEFSSSMCGGRLMKLGMFFSECVCGSKGEGCPSNREGCSGCQVTKGVPVYQDHVCMI